MSRLRTGGWATAAIVAALLLTCAGARAATITSVTACDGVHGSCSEIVSYEAGPGEANDVTAKSGYSTVVVHDAGAPLEAGRGCQQRGVNGAECTAYEYESFVRIDTGDGDDRVTGPVAGDVILGPGDDVLDGPGVNTAAGGPGDDLMIHGDEAITWYGEGGNDRISATGFAPRLEGGPGDDDVEGGPSGETLNGGPGSDVVRGLEGDDVLVADDHDEYDDHDTPSPAADSLDGGEGVDWVTYDFRSDPVTVDLGHPESAGAPGEGDVLTSIEDAGGGSAGDVLTGDGGANRLNGGPGDDTLTGRAGDDAIEGAQGFDRISAGAGNDVIEPGGGRGVDAKEEPIACGEGTDVLRSVDLDVPGPDCEKVVFDAAGREATLRLRPLIVGPDALTFRVPCPRPLRVAGRCRGRLTLSGHGERRVRNFNAGKSGGFATVRRPAATRVRLTLRYRAHPDAAKPYTYGVSVYLDLPAADGSAARVTTG